MRTAQQLMESNMSSSCTPRPYRSYSWSNSRVGCVQAPQQGPRKGARTLDVSREMLVTSIYNSWMVLQDMKRTGLQRVKKRKTGTYLHAYTYVKQVVDLLLFQKYHTVCPWASRHNGHTSGETSFELLQDAYCWKQGLCLTHSWNRISTFNERER